jgi:hypothetical protein
MPYIAQKDREKFSAFTQSMKDLDIKTAGELNYLLTMLTHRYLNQKPESYQMYNDAVGALEGAKLELYRRHVAPYENIKIKENGDV